MEDCRGTCVCVSNFDPPDFFSICSYSISLLHSELLTLNVQLSFEVQNLHNLTSLCQKCKGVLKKKKENNFSALLDVFFLYCKCTAREEP